MTGSVRQTELVQEAPARKLTLKGDCSSYRYTYTGSQVHVLIADNGRQVN